jgi:integrase
MPRIKLTERVIPTLKGRSPSSKSREPMFWFDITMPGFGVTVSTKTGLKRYFAQRDLPNGKTRRIIIGAYRTEIKTLDEARTKAADILHGMRHGIDPKAAAKGSITLAQAAEAYLAARPNLAESSIRGYRRAFEKYLSEWADWKLTEITRDRVEARHLALAEETGDPSTANGVMRALRAVFNYAIDRYPDVTANPVRLKGQWFKEYERDDHVSGDDLPKFFRAVNQLENPVARDYLLLLLFTGLRREEAASLTWNDIDFAAKIIRLPAVRTKAGRRLDLPMSDFVFKLLQKRRELGDAVFVFPATSASGHIAEPRHFLGLIEEATEIAVTPHGLRRTFSTTADYAGVNEPVIAAMLNHGQSATITARYIIKSAEQLRDPVQRTADQLMKWIKTKK